jgi:prevent-host-death family protein
MQTFTSIDLQKQTGDVQRAASRDGAIITSHGKPRNVMLSIEEYRRLKLAAGETLPELAEARPAVVRHRDDPLGFDVHDFRVAARRMAEDALTGRNDAAVTAELNALRSWLNR